MDIRLQPVSSRQDLKKYIQLPAGLYNQFSNWVPPLYADEWAFHDPNKNPALRQAQVIRILAYRNEELVGRIMGIIHTYYNSLKGEKTARFFNFDCVNDISIAKALIQRIEGWAIENGMNKLIGPYGFSDKDPQGAQVEGFEHLPVIGTPSHAPYLPNLIEANGFTKEIDCVSYSFPVPKKLPVVYQNILERTQRSTDWRIKEFKSKKELQPFILPVLQLVNETYAPLFGFVPMSEDEMIKLAKQYMPVLDPELVKLVVDQNTAVVAFVVALPEISIGIKRAKGRLFPFGFIHILNAARTAKQLNLMLGAIKPDVRGIGINVLLAKSLFETALRRDFQSIDSHLILETNRLMRAECERLGGTVYKRYRVYQKMLTNP